jgi:hypothetical protein
MIWLIVIFVFIGVAWFAFWTLNVVSLVVEEWRSVSSE